MLREGRETGKSSERWRRKRERGREGFGRKGNQREGKGIRKISEM